MSAVSNNHKLNNGNLMTLTGKSQVQQQPTNQHQQQHQQYSQQSQQQHFSQQQLQQQQQQQQHQQTLSPQSSSSSSSVTSSTHMQQQLHQHQTQTVATVHQQMSGGHHHQPVSGSSIPTAQHTIPPRYQPPPQPPGGILKHIPISSSIKATSSSYYPVSPPELTAPHLNIKYPPEIPKLASVYIPDSVKNSGNPTRFTQRQQIQNRTSGGNIPVLVQNSSLHHSINEDHFTRQHQSQQQQEMLKFVRKTDSVDPNGGSNGAGTSGQGITANAGQSTVGGSGRLTAEQNRHLQSLLSELRALKEANQRLIDDNQELRDLCCFLDDDRQKGRKLAREWQRFGRYTASVMRQEVSAYQNKLRQLDDKQQELIRDNLELKELCLYLDEERAHVAANTLCANCGAPTRPALRDDGDGSSSSTNADETISATIRQYERQIPVELNVRSTLSDQTLQYVRSLERRIRQLEEERLSIGIGGNGVGAGVVTTNGTIQQIPDPISGRPEAVVRALQVLEVREQLERDRGCNNGLVGTQSDSATPTEQMDDGEKALVREMCNVVWRKLEESPNGQNMDPI